MEIRSRKRRGNSRYYLFFFVSIIFIVLIGFAAWYALTHMNIFTLEKVTVAGNTSIPDSLVIKITKPYIGTNLISIRSSEVKAKLSSISRIKEVKLRKKLMHTLHLQITERKGLIYIKSVEGDLYPIDADCVVLASCSPIYMEDLPIYDSYLTNSQLQSGKKLKNAKLSRILEIHQLIAIDAPDFLANVSEYYFIDNTVNIIDAKHGTRIIPSDDDLAKQLSRYQFVQDNGNINKRSVVDLRFKNQVVVKAGNK